MKFSSENIIWIKNVKKSKGEGWAYDDVACNEPFLLHWSSSKGGSAETPNVGDIIVRTHIQQEIIIRNSKIVQKAKNDALRKGNGRINF